MTEASEADLRHYVVGARSTDVFGRVLCSAREHHFVVDGPAQNGCPGEELTPAEVFLAGIASCGVELLQVFARREDVPLRSVEVFATGELDLENPVRPDVTVFNRVRLAFRLAGVDGDQGALLVDRFKGR